jgi:hypothetical protein
MDAVASTFDRLPNSVVSSLSSSRRRHVFFICTHCSFSFIISCHHSSRLHLVYHRLIDDESGGGLGLFLTAVGGVGAGVSSSKSYSRLVNLTMVDLIMVGLLPTPGADADTFFHDCHRRWRLVVLSSPSSSFTKLTMLVGLIKLTMVGHLVTPNADANVFFIRTHCSSLILGDYLVVLGDYLHTFTMMGLFPVAFFCRFCYIIVVATRCCHLCHQHSACLDLVYTFEHDKSPNKTAKMKTLYNTYGWTDSNNKNLSTTTTTTTTTTKTPTL